jgi:glutamate--cysteine ligase
MEVMFDSVGPFGRRMMRQTLTIHVNVDFGGPRRAPLRWRAAHELAPILLASFAHSPLVEGRVTEWKSFRGRVWRDVDPSRCGFPPKFLQQPASPPVEQYVDFAMKARVMVIRHDSGWRCPSRPVSFVQWMEQGQDDTFPTLDDWHYHLTTLFPEVRPKGFLELRSADSQGRAFWSVPLTLASALLTDDTALRELLDLTAGRQVPSNVLMQRAARNALADAELGALARQVFAVAERAIDRAPTVTYSEPMRRAFAAFDEQFVARGRTPADAVLEVFQQRGKLGRAGLEELHDGWCASVGMDGGCLPRMPVVGGTGGPG